MTSSAIKELDRVALTEPLPEYGLVAGDIGTVVLIHQDGQGYTVEFLTLSGETVAIATVEASAVRPLRAREVTHAREVA